MKILIVAHHFPPHISGVGNVAAQQAKYLVEGGNEVVVLTSDCSDKASVAEHDGYTIHRLRALNFTETHMHAPYPIFSPTLIWRMYGLVQGADVVHVHDSFYVSSFVAAICAKLLRKPLFVTQHIAMIPHPSKLVMATERIVYTTSGKFIFKTSKKIFVINDRVREFLITQKVSTEKIVTVVNGVDLEIFHPATPKQKNKLRKGYGLPLDKSLALFIGRYVPKKGFDKLLKASDRKYTLVFAGGKHNPAHESEDKIFLGLLSQSQIAEVYRACDVFVLPSEGEGFPLSIQEAMASGLPIIAGDDYGYRPYKLDKSLFYLIEPTVNEIKTHLIKVVEDKSLRQAMGKYSLHYARKYFNWRSVTQTIITQYSETLS